MKKITFRKLFLSNIILFFILGCSPNEKENANNASAVLNSEADDCKVKEDALSDTKSIYESGLCYCKTGQFVQSKKAFEKALEIDNFLTPAQEGFTILNDVLNKKIKDKTAIHICNGIVHGNQGNLNKELQEFEAAIEQDPSYEVIYSNRSILFLHKGLYHEALSDCNKAISLNPRYASAYNNRGTINMSKGNFTSAIADYDKAIEVNPKYVGAIRSRGYANEKLGLSEKAISDYNKAIEINPKYVAAYLDRGNTYRKTGFYEKAVADYSKTIDLDISNFRAWFNKGYTLEKMNRKEEAIMAYEGFIKHAPQSEIKSINSAKEKIEKLKRN